MSSSFIALTALIIMLAATAATACANPANSGNASALKLPFLVQLGSQGSQTMLLLPTDGKLALNPWQTPGRVRTFFDTDAAEYK